LHGHKLAFAADENAHTIGLAGHIEQTHELCFLFKQIEGLTQVTHVAREIANRQQIALTRNHHIAFVFAHGLGAHLHGSLHEAGNFRLQIDQLLLDSQADLLNGHANVMRVQIIRSFYELALRIVGLGKDDAVLHIAFGRHNDQEHAFFRQPQKFNVPKHRSALGRHDHAHIVRQARKHVGRVGNHLLRLVGCKALREQFTLLNREHGVDE